MLASWQQSLQADLSVIEKKNRKRFLRVNGGRLDFASNDYLSLNSSGVIKELLKARLAAWSNSIGSTGSRLLRGHHEAFEQAEAAFQTFVQSESALLFHSGYAANVGVLQTLLSAKDTVFCDRSCHASILDGIRISGAQKYYFDHNDLDHLKSVLKKRPARGQAWLITESVFSMDGDSPEMETLVAIAEESGLLIYLDEAHAIGVKGETGNGLACERKLQDRIAVRVFPCGKAPGLMGAFVCGPRILKESLINRCRSFIFSTSQPPLLAAVLGDVIGLLPGLTKERSHLEKIADRLRAGLQARTLNSGPSTSHIVPLILGSEDRAMNWMQNLQDRGIDVRAIRPPSVAEGSSRLRINLQAGHSVADVELLLKELYTIAETETK
ncbi:MAG: 8-amino-7-oxononanoate synthase [Leptospirales bacterium]|nr:8-amino-7-oxononanoate synthase [Leptospirales bacterium]